MKSPEEIRTALEGVKPGSPDEMLLLGQFRAESAMDRKRPQPQGEANAQSMIDTAQHEIVLRDQIEAGHAGHMAVHATVQGGDKQATNIEVHRP